ncbi:hypothetical protein TNCV_1862471 [Trichonephila clavipes]|nr:hypothetical protein TNCV_1862471 [Trichonephila clavipes]
MRWWRGNMQSISIIPQTHITKDSSTTDKRYIRGEQIDDLKYKKIGFWGSEMSTRRPLLRVLLTNGNYKRLGHQWSMNNKHGQRNETTLYLLTNPSSTCNIKMIGFEFEDTVVRGC